MNPTNHLLANPIFSNPLVIAAGVALGLLIAMIIVYVRVVKKKKARAAAAAQGGKGVTIILLRGRTPLGAILTGCTFVNGHYTYLPKSTNPHLILYDGRYVRNNPDGEPFLFYDTEARAVVGYTGETANADDVTLVFHDGTTQDVPAKEAEVYKVADKPDGTPGQKTVYRKHAGLWRVLNGTRLYQEKNTLDWDNIQRTTASWLALLQQYFPIIAIFFFVVIVIIGLIAVV